MPSSSDAAFGHATAPSIAPGAALLLGVAEPAACADRAYVCASLQPESGIDAAASCPLVHLVAGAR
eukprot:COSAG04_NODE_1346_length_7137_cov_620.694231_8_plen_66_part_00